MVCSFISICCNSHHFYLRRESASLRSHCLSTVRQYSPRLVGSEPSALSVKVMRQSYKNLLCSSEGKKVK